MKDLGNIDVKINTQAVAITKEEFREKGLEAGKRIMIEIGEKDPGLSLVILTMSAMFIGEMTDLIFGEEKM